MRRTLTVLLLTIATLGAPAAAHASRDIDPGTTVIWPGGGTR